MEGKKGLVKKSKKVINDNVSESESKEMSQDKINLSLLELEEDKKINDRGTKNAQNSNKNKKIKKVKNAKKVSKVEIKEIEEEESSLKINNDKRQNKNSNKSFGDGEISENNSFTNDDQKEDSRSFLLESAKIVKGEPKNFKGNGNMHYLPYKMNYDGYARVDIYFDSLIKENNNNNLEQNKRNYKDKHNYISKSEYKTSFRGRIFNGNKINLKEENSMFGVMHVAVNKDKENNLTFLSGNNLDSYYVWKFDENIDFYKKQNLLNMNKIITDLNKLA